MEAIEFSNLVPGTLIIVWNAESGWQQALLDSVHKLVSPATYSCSLCQLTHGGLGAKRAWKDFLQNSDRPVVFLHRNEFEPLRKGSGMPQLRLPVVLEQRPESIGVLLSAEQIGDLPDLPALLTALENRF